MKSNTHNHQLFAFDQRWKLTSLVIIIFVVLTLAGVMMGKWRLINQSGLGNFIGEWKLIKSEPPGADTPPYLRITQSNNSAEIIVQMNRAVSIPADSLSLKFTPVENGRNLLVSGEGFKAIQGNWISETNEKHWGMNQIYGSWRRDTGKIAADNFHYAKWMKIEKKQNIIIISFNDTSSESSNENRMIFNLSSDGSILSFSFYSHSDDPQGMGIYERKP